MAFPPHSSELFLLLLLLTLLPPSLLQLQHQRPKLSTGDLNALIAIKNTLTDVSPAGHFFSTWDFASSDPCSSFSGVTCTLDPFAPTPTFRVSILSLGVDASFSDSSGLAGSLSHSISNLTELTQLILSSGIVTGPIPPLIGTLKNLRVISLANNRLTGTIPTSLSSLKNLHTLDLSYNQLTGSIPPSLTELPRLKVLILSANSLNGELPHVTAQLLHLDLRYNRLAGTLPPSMPSSLRYLSLSRNNLWGPLSNGFFESLSELVFLDLSMNGFSGPLPPSLFLIPSLSSLLLQRNNLSGRVPQPPPQHVGPTEEGMPLSSLYGEGSIVDLSHNSLAGELSSTVLAGVESLFLNNNRLTGNVPEEYVKSVCRGSTRTLYLQHNYITGFPLEEGVAVPDTVSLCLSYNCMAPPVGVMVCPASAGAQVARPVSQCLAFRNHSCPDNS